MAATSPLAIVLMGVAGSGKSTTGAAPSRAPGWPFRDADSFHPPADIEMMRGLRSTMPTGCRGRPPSRMDRRAACGGRARHHLLLGAQRAYGESIIRRRESVRLVHLEGDAELIARRLAARRNERDRSG
jgi:gluconate kinase